LETERRLNQSQEEIKRLKDFEKLASAKIRAAESAHKSAEAGLMNMERQVTKLKEKLDREYTTSSRLRLENSRLKDAVNEARAEVQKAEGEAQSYYDQGFDEAASSLKSQLASECNKFFVQGWRMALDKAGVDDASELYDLVPRHRPFEVDAPEERDGEETAEDSTVPKPREVMNEPELAVDPEVAEDPGHFEADDRIRMVEVQEEDDDSDGEENVDVVD
jgi:regulator of replication initiation timing